MDAPSSPVIRASEWVGWPLSSWQAATLERFGRWLVEEAQPAGGIGPHEHERVESRHVADALLFAAGWEGSSPPQAVVDVGSGVGLPGIPLAVLWPETTVTCVERSGKRATLARRAVRILRLPNVDVIHEDAGRAEKRAAAMVVARAAAPVPEVREWARKMAPEAVLVVGGSHRTHPGEGGPGERVLEVPAGVLDRPVWLRIMAPP